MARLVTKFAVHMQKEPGTAPEHLEYLAVDDGDRRRPFISSLCDALGQRGKVLLGRGHRLFRRLPLGMSLKQQSSYLIRAQNLDKPFSKKERN